VTLGQTIVRELHLEASVDTLGRWMAHYLAELLAEAERPGPQQDAARRRCSDFVLKLWEKRAAWPTGWPPAGAAAVLAAIYPLARPERGRGHREEPDEPMAPLPWTQHFEAMHSLQERELRVWHAAILTEYDLENERTLLAQHREDLTEDQLATLEWMISSKDSLSGNYARIDTQKVPNFAALDAGKRAELILSALGNIGAERQKLLEEMRQKTLGDEAR
jgi:hypothetical protein